MATYVFISDLHLSEQHPCLTQGFFALLEYYQSYQNVHLYILGDWFNTWLGDDVHGDWLDKIIQHLQSFTQVGHQIYFLAGNRDFLLGQNFLQQFCGQLLNDIHYLNIADYRIRLEHGDGLCTRDVEYQRFKKLIRSPIMLMILKNLPKTLRQKLADQFRRKSKYSHQYKNLNIMDVQIGTVNEAMKNIDILIHGHTHRPDIHQYSDKQRIVLGDWQEHENVVEAMILELSDLGVLNFYLWKYFDTP